MTFAGSISPARNVSNPLLSVIIPCYNESAVLSILYERISVAARGWGMRYEIIAVDDGSSDATWEMLAKFTDADPAWKAIRLARNFGHQIALWAGLKHASGDVVAVLDADLQDPPETLPFLLEKWKEGYDVVYAVRRKRKEGAFKLAAYYCYYRVLAFLAEIEVPLDSGDFCVMDRRVVETMSAITEQQPFIRGLRAWVGFRQIGVPYERDRRAAGEVKYTFKKLTQLALNGIFSYSTRPLKLATYLGFLVSIVAFLGIIFVFLQRIFSQQFAEFGMPYVPGFATIVIAILFMGGVQLVCVGILGEYVARIYENVRGRPQFTVSDSRGLVISCTSPPAVSRIG
jgi:polyisoprenyl-phosphate glycosyltransferase